MLEILIRNKENLSKEDYEMLYQYIDNKENYKYVKIVYNECIAEIINNDRDLELLFKDYIIKLPKYDDYSLKFLELLLVYQLFENLPYDSYKDIIRRYGNKSIAYKKLEEKWECNYNYYIEKFEDKYNSSEQEKILAYHIIDKHILEFKEINIDEKQYISESDSDISNSNSSDSESKYEKSIIDIDECIDYFINEIYP